MKHIDKQGSAPSGPPLRAGRVRLRGVHDRDFHFLFELATSFETLHLWDDGHIETVERRFVETFLQKADSRTFFVVEGEPVDGGEPVPIGLAYLYSFDPINQWAYYTVALGPGNLGQGAGDSASTLAVNWAFFTWNLHKLYVEILSDNHAAIAVAERLGFVAEGHLAEHRRINGEYRDVDVLSLGRRRWIEQFRADAYARAEARRAHT